KVRPQLIGAAAMRAALQLRRQPAVPFHARGRLIRVPPEHANVIQRRVSEDLGDERRHAGVVIRAAVGHRAAQRDDAVGIELHIGLEDAVAATFAATALVSTISTAPPVDFFFALLESDFALTVADTARMVLRQRHPDAALEAAVAAARRLAPLLPADRLDPFGTHLFDRIGVVGELAL